MQFEGIAVHGHQGGLARILQVEDKPRLVFVLPQAHCLDQAVAGDPGDLDAPFPCQVKDDALGIVELEAVPDHGGIAF